MWRFVRLLWRAPLAHREAVRLAQVMWRRSYRDVAPHWRPLEDTAGVISQIDNMHAGALQDIEELRTKYRITFNALATITSTCEPHSAAIASKAMCAAINVPSRDDRDLPNGRDEPRRA
jgi:hypothetical protein